jgi:regulator of RNase E activity RraB
VTSEGVDQQRLEQEWAADRDVLARLSEQGDQADQVRKIDVSFVGGERQIQEAEAEASRRGFQTVQVLEHEGGEWRLDVARLQTARTEDIRQLTIIALQIEAACGVSYDGWGCITQNDRA